ncbi:MAG: hypothetical protein LBQ94_04515 [Treponema sp.]|jgi:predicted RNA-binding Zn-ribbon protein involved in translation (DUF1610 family)|nr:hypothetical protein [Treponema sp.]
MADYNFFELVGLPFDPPEKAVKKIIAAIDKVKKELETVRGTSTQQLERDEINRKLAFLETTSSAIFSNDGKLTAVYEKLSKEKLGQETKNLSAIVSLLKQSGSRKITNGTIRIHQQKSKLSREHVEEVFRTAGFTITEIEPFKMPEFPVNADKIYAELEALRKSKDSNPNGADLTKAVDLYAFAAYLADEPENAGEYRSKSTPDLANIFDDFAKKFAMRNDNLGKLCASLATAGKAYVFNSESNRKNYEAYLKYKSPALTQLFSSMRGVSKSDLLDPKFAEECIRQISELFGSPEYSLGIYNKEAGLKDEPYVPPKVVFRVKCHHCQNLSEFADVGEAQKVNKCPHCGKALYKQCKKCSKSVLASLDKCPECGFFFASAAMFAKYFAAAEQALRKGDFESARGFLFQAQSADPGEKQRIDELTSRITADEKKYEKPINDLRKLVADRMFQRASEMMAEIVSKFPGLNVSALETQINTALSQARAMFANAKKLSPSRQADECLAILQDCVDFRPAISFLQATPPEACRNFSVGIDSSAGFANISWSRSPEQAVSYRLVRKHGKDIPTNEMDGEILADNIKDTTYRDIDILPGQWYGYAVFAIRQGVFSSAVGKAIVLLADVTDVNDEQINMTIRLTWNNPKNCTGVIIRRTLNGKETILTDNANRRYEDDNILYGNTYSYKLCAKYANQSASQGVNIVITPTPMLNEKSFAITVKQLEKNTYNVSWTINQSGIDLRVLVNEKQVRELKSDAGSCDLKLSADGFYTITVLASSGGNWLRSGNSPQVNTYSPCSIDKVSSYFREEPITGLRESAHRMELHLKIGGTIPPNVVGFYYSVRTGNAQNRWANIQEVGTASDIRRIKLADYLKSGEIFYTETAREEGAYYVSLFTIYKMDGKEIVSDPKPCRFDRPLEANLLWQVDKSLLGGLRLAIEVSGNRPIKQIPELKLCACAENQHLLSYNDANSIQLLTIPSNVLGIPQKTHRNNYDVNTDLSVKQLKGAKFFLFVVEPVPGEEFTPRKSKGLIGKV